MELSVAIQAKVEVTPSNWNFGFQPTAVFRQFPGTIPGFSPGSLTVSPEKNNFINTLKAA